MSFYSIAPFIKEFYPQYYSIESYPATECVRVHKVAEEWGIFSNFAATPIEIDGVVFKSAEQLFQIMKFKDEEQIMTVYEAGNPKMPARHWEKTHRREDWKTMIVDAIKFCITEEIRAIRGIQRETGFVCRTVHCRGSDDLHEENTGHMGCEAGRGYIHRAEPSW